MTEYKTCKRCGQTQPIGNYHQAKASLDGKRNTCKKCTKELDAARYKKNASQQRERALDYYYQNKEAQLAKHKQRRDSDPVAYAHRRRQNRLKNLEVYKRLEYEQRLRHRDRRLAQQRLRSKETIELNTIKNNRRRARLASTASYKVSVKEMAKLKSSPCFVCGNLGKKEIDHIIPLSRSGTNGIGNYMALCEPCNASKYNKTFMEWRLYRIKVENPLPMDVQNV
jgi:5-methylcytosine-specific restriction endonuclease McrA